MKELKLLILAGLFGLSACGGGGTGTGDGVVDITGSFVDSPVQGLRFETATLKGSTDANGNFKYRAGEVVNFYLGEILIGSAAGAKIVSPVDLVTGATDETDPQVTNILRFLQSLDNDSNPDNGIIISDSTINALQGQVVDFTLSEANFESAFNSLSATLLGSIPMVSVTDARNHFVNYMDFLNGEQVHASGDQCLITYFYNQSPYTSICYQNLPASTSCSNTGTLATDPSQSSDPFSVTYQSVADCSNADSVIDASLLDLTNNPSGDYGTLYLFGTDTKDVGNKMISGSVGGEEIPTGDILMIWQDDTLVDSNNPNLSTAVLSVAGYDNKSSKIAISFNGVEWTSNSTYNLIRYSYEINCYDSPSNVIDINSECLDFGINHTNKTVTFNGATLNPIVSSSSVTNSATGPITLQGTLKW